MTPVIPPDMIERISSAMRAKRAELQHAPLDRIYGELFEAGLSALGDTHVMVPRLASDKMICAALDDWDKRRHGQTYGHIWTAMIAAATPGSQE